MIWFARGYQGRDPPLSTKYAVYHLIEIADRLQLITTRILEPVVFNPMFSDAIKDEAHALIAQAHCLAERIADVPDIAVLCGGLSELRVSVEGFMRRIAILAR